MGEFFVYMEDTPSSYMFLSLPEMNIRDVPQSKFVFGIDNGILDKVESLPKKIRVVCEAQYKANKYK